jgi:hypothetical protein
MQAFGYTTETLQFMLQPMVKEHRDPVGSMGNDSMLAVLSDKPRMLYDYFRQLFAQVTNPPVDSIREEVIMSLECYVGPEANLLETTPEARRAPAAAPADPFERGAHRPQEAEPPRLEGAHDRHHVRARRRAGRPKERDRQDLPRGGSGNRRRMQLSGAVGPQHRPRTACP